MRCNCGVNPVYLTDQWIIAEQVELLMIPGMLRRLNYQPKSPIPEQFSLGKGHMLFWVNKLIYLKRRHEEVKKEVARRGFKVTGREINLHEFPKQYHNDWTPSCQESKILRSRLYDKYMAKDENFWRYKSEYIYDLDFFKGFMDGELYYV